MSPAIDNYKRVNKGTLGQSCRSAKSYVIANGGLLRKFIMIQEVSFVHGNKYKK